MKGLMIYLIIIVLAIVFGLFLAYHRVVGQNIGVNIGNKHMREDFGIEENKEEKSQ